MSTLYELTGQRLALQSKLEAMKFDDETIADTLEGEASEIEAKVIDYGYVIKNRTAFSDAIRAEIDRLQERLKMEENRVAKIEDFLLSNMVACSIKKIECPVFSISVRDNPPSVDIQDQFKIPLEYWRTPEPKPPVSAPDKKAIMDALKKGREIPGCAIKRTHKLVIK